MTRDDIVRMARDANIGTYINLESHLVGNHLERFAELVAATEREVCAKVVEQAGMEGYGTLAAALLVRERGAP